MKITWFGHSAFRVDEGDVHVLFDPFLTGNPLFKGSLDAAVAGATHVLLTHGHNDHFGDTVAILEKTGATLVSTYELCSYVESVSKGAKTVGMNLGGVAPLGALSVAMVRADHSSVYAAPDGRMIYGGACTGLILRVGARSVYHMGDTAAFSDMALINARHRPEIGIVPMGGFYTMDAEDAADAVNRWFDFKAVLPAHYRTFPGLAPNADVFRAKVAKAMVHTPEPMASVEL